MQRKKGSILLYQTFAFLMVRMTGEERKTVDNCFSRTKSTKQGEMKKIYDFSTFRLCDSTGEPTRLSTLEPDGKDTSVEVTLFLREFRLYEL